MLNFSKNRTISSLMNNGQPNMAETLTGWEIPLTLIRVIQGVNEGELTTTEQTFNFMGVLQPLRTEELLLKPEGQRSWSYYWIHTKSTLDFKTADKIIYQNKRYKVTAIKDYDLNGFRELEVILDYESST